MTVAMHLRRTPNKQPEVRKGFWSPLVTTVAVLLLILYRSCSPNDSLSSVAEILSEVVFWSSLGTALSVLLLFLYRSIPQNFSVSSVAEILLEVGKLLRSASQAKSIPAVVSLPFDKVWDEPKSSQELFKNDTKIMWGFWDSGLEGMPDTCRYAIKSWEVHNPNWKIIILDDNNYQEYVSVSDLPTTFFSLKVQHRSDLLRIAVLLRYGGAYMDASTLVFKSFDRIWDSVDKGKLMLTSLNSLPDSGLDLFNNGLLMAKGTNNTVLSQWQQRMLRYTENPSLTLEDMAKNPEFSRVADHFTDPSLGLLSDMIPYHSNLWMLNDLIWNNGESVANKVLSLPRSRWGIWFSGLPHLVEECQRQRSLGNSERTLDPSTEPKTISWTPLGLLGIAPTLIRMSFEEDIDLAKRILENLHAIKFTSHDLGLIEMGLEKFGHDNTMGYLYRAATDKTLFPVQQANLAGAVEPTTVRRTVIEQ